MHIACYAVGDAVHDSSGAYRQLPAGPPIWDRVTPLPAPNFWLLVPGASLAHRTTPSHVRVEEATC